MGYRKFIANGVNVHIYEFNPMQERIAVEIGVPHKLEMIDKMARPRENEEVVCMVNASFFDWQGGSDGYGEIEQDGKQYKPESKGFPSISYKDGKLVFGDLPNAQMGVGVGVTLLIDGKIAFYNPSHVTTGKDARTAIAQLKNGNIVLWANEGDDTKNKGFTSSQIANYLLNLGAIQAFQFDSGGSTAMYTGGKYVFQQGRAVASAIVVYKKKESFKYMVNASKLNIRKSPSILGFILGQYKKNDVIIVLDIANGWARTDKGYVSAKYLTRM